MNGDRHAVAPAAGAAIVFGVLGIVSAVMTGPPPLPEKSVPDVVAWYQHHRQGVYASQLLLAVAAAALLWFASRIRHAVSDDARGHAATLSTSSAAAAALFIVGGWAQLALAVGVNRPGEAPSPGGVRVLSDLTWMQYGGLTVVVTVVAASLSMLLLAGAVGARWVGVVGLIATVLSAVGAVAAFFPNTAGKQDPVAILGLIGFLVLAVTTVLTGVTMLRGSTGGRGQPAGKAVRAAV